MKFELDGLHYEIRFKNQRNGTYVVSIISTSPCSDDIVYTVCLGNETGVIQKIKYAIRQCRVELSHKNDQGRPEIECKYSYYTDKGWFSNTFIVRCDETYDDLNKLVKQHKTYYNLEHKYLMCYTTLKLANKTICEYFKDEIDESFDYFDKELEQGLDDISDEESDEESD